MQEVTPVVELEDVSFGYRAGVRVLEDVSLEVGAGEFVAIAGPNGGGKTTLLRLVLGLERPTTGTVRVFGQPSGKGADGARVREVAEAGLEWAESKRRPSGVKVAADVDPTDVL